MLKNKKPYLSLLLSYVMSKEYEKQKVLLDNLFHAPVQKKIFPKLKQLLAGTFIAGLMSGIFLTSMISHHSVTDNSSWVTTTPGEHLAGDVQAMNFSQFFIRDLFTMDKESFQFEKKGIANLFSDNTKYDDFIHALNSSGYINRLDQGHYVYSNSDKEVSIESVKQENGKTYYQVAVPYTQTWDGKEHSNNIAHLLLVKDGNSSHFNIDHIIIASDKS